MFFMKYWEYSAGDNSRFKKQIHMSYYRGSGMYEHPVHTEETFVYLGKRDSILGV